jgi:hypothetical protein
MEWFLQLSFPTMMLLFVLSFTGFVLICILQNKYSRKAYVKHLFDEQYFGVVDSVYRDPEDILRHGPVVLFSNHTKRLQDAFCYDYQLAKGDIIFKRAKSFQFYLVRGKDTVKYFNSYGGEEIKSF